MNPPVVALEQFEGPLDLLLSLVRKNEVDITDLPIAEITRQYLEYLEDAEALDLDLGAEFAYMAATLIHIKSGLLLPPDPELAAREPDPREDLVRQLLDHEEMRKAAEFLHQQLELTGATWTKGSMEEFAGSAADVREPAADSASINLMELLRLAKRAVDTARTHDLLQLDIPDVPVEEMAAWLRRRIGESPHRPLCANNLLAEQDGRPREVSLFLAMLELSKNGEIQLEQDAPFAPIRLSGTM